MSVGVSMPVSTGIVPSGCFSSSFSNVSVETDAMVSFEDRIRIAPLMSPSLNFAWTNFKRIASVSFGLFDFLRRIKFAEMFFMKTSNGSRLSFVHVSRFLFTIVAMDKLFVTLFFRSGDFRAMYENVNRWIQVLTGASRRKQAVIRLANSIATWIRAAFGILFMTDVWALTVWTKIRNSFIRSALVLVASIGLSVSIDGATDSVVVAGPSVGPVRDSACFFVVWTLKPIWPLQTLPQMEHLKFVAGSMIWRWLYQQNRELDYCDRPTIPACGLFRAIFVYFSTQ